MEDSKYDGQIAQAVETMKRAREKVIRAYCKKIQDLFFNGNERTREAIKSELESIINKEQKKNVFDYEKAKRIRITLNLTLKELGTQIGGVPQQTLSHYETGKVCPPKTSMQGIKYLSWLKQEGYNPFDI